MVGAAVSTGIGVGCDHLENRVVTYNRLKGYCRRRLICLRESLHASEEQRPEFTQTWKGKSFPCFENRRDSGTKSNLSHREEGTFGISLWDQAENRGKLHEELTRSGEGPGESDDGTPQVETLTFN